MVVSLASCALNKTHLESTFQNHSKIIIQKSRKHNWKYLKSQIKMAEMRWNRVSNGQEKASLRPLKTICYRPEEEIVKERRRLLNRLEKKRLEALEEMTHTCIVHLNNLSQQSIGNPEDFDNEFSPVKKRKTF